MSSIFICLQPLSSFPHLKYGDALVSPVANDDEPSARVTAYPPARVEGKGERGGDGVDVLDHSERLGRLKGDREEGGC